MSNQEETRKCDLCGEKLARMWLKKSKEVDWQFQGEFAHLECYIDLIAKRKVIEHFDKADLKGDAKKEYLSLREKVMKWFS